MLILGITQVCNVCEGKHIEQTKINTKVNPEYPWTIIIIGGETGRQMVQTMQITSGGVLPSMFQVAHALRTLVHAHVLSAGYFRF